MSNFTDNQHKELSQSAITSDLAEINIEHLEGDRALDTIFYALPSEERRNDGRISNKWLRKYDHIHKHGGMAFYGVNPIDGSRSECISFKPTQPLSPDRKYEQPPKSTNQAFYPAVTDRVWELVADRFAVPMPDDKSMTFWVWVLTNCIPVIITEGCKKALAAMSHGFPAVALMGIWNGVAAHRDEHGKTQGYSLMPSLKFLEGAKINIGFDRDEKARTIAAVMQARAALAGALIDNDCECYSIVWDSKYKGLDDLIVGAGVAGLEQSIATAKVQTGEPPNFKKKIVKNMMAEDLAKESKDRLSFDAISKTWYVYTDGRWKAKGQDGMESVIYHRVIQDVPEINSTNFIPDILKFMKYKLTVEEWTEACTHEFFPFKNGVWSFKNKELLPHSPDYFWKWQLARDYSPIATGWDSIDRFLKLVTGDDESLRNLLIAVCAAVLHGRSDLQQAFYLFGSGANGKGTFMKLLEMLVGNDNSHSTTLEALCDNKFETANIYGKRLVICPDEDKRVGGMSVFKSIVGEDTIRGEEKGAKAFQFVYKGTVAISSNDPIFMGDNTYGLSRKLISIPFYKTIPKSERKKSEELAAEFTTDLPFFTSYLLNIDQNWVTKTLKQASNIKSIKDLEWELTTRTDSVAAFYDAQMIYAPGAEVSAKAVFEMYKKYGEESGFNKLKHINNFCPALVKLLTDKLGKDVSSRKTKAGKVIEGVRLRSVQDPIGDDGDGGDGFFENSEKKISDDLVDEVMTVTAVTAQMEKQFNLDLSPKPPTVDRPIPQTVKVDDYVEYQIVDGEVKWLEIAFHKYSIAREWEHQISLWGAKTVKPHQINRHGKRWILQVSGLSIARLEQLLAAELGQSPRQPSRR